MTKTYQGRFCWHGEDHILFTESNRPTSAFGNMCTQLAKKVGYSRSAVVGYFLGTNRYIVEEVKPVSQ